MNDTEILNPYAPPAEPGLVSPLTSSVPYEVRGKGLAVRNGATLPPRCIKTNKIVVPGENGKIKTIKLNWLNPWWALLIIAPFGLLILIIICLTKTAKGSVTVHLSNTAIRKKRIRFSSAFLLALALFGLTPLLTTTSPDVLPFTLLGGLVCLIIGFLSLRYLTPKNFKSDWFLVKGFHLDFLRDIDSEKAATTSGPGS